MYKLFHGLLSLLMMATTFVIGFSGIFLQSKVYAAVYFFVGITGMSFILMAFCSKCPCRQNACTHLIFGKLTKFFPQRKTGVYSLLDYFLTSVGFAIIALYPQYWLIEKPLLLVSFWVVILLLFAEILFFICKKCGNEFCPAKR